MDFCHETVFAIFWLFLQSWNKKIRYLSFHSNYQLKIILPSSQGWLAQRESGLLHKNVLRGTWIWFSRWDIFREWDFLHSVQLWCFNNFIWKICHLPRTCCSNHSLWVKRQVTWKYWSYYVIFEGTLCHTQLYTTPHHQSSNLRWHSAYSPLCWEGAM